MELFYPNFKKFLLEELRRQAGWLCKKSDPGKKRSRMDNPQTWPWKKGTVFNKNTDLTGPCSIFILDHWRLKVWEFYLSVLRSALCSHKSWPQKNLWLENPSGENSPFQHSGNCRRDMVHDIQVTSDTLCNMSGEAKKTTCADGEKYLAARTPLAGQKLLEAETDVTWRVMQSCSHATCTEFLVVDSTIYVVSKNSRSPLIDVSHIFWGGGMVFHRWERVHGWEAWNYYTGKTLLGQDSTVKP